MIFHMQSSKCHYSIMLIVTKNYTTKVTGNISTFKTVTKSTKLLCYYYFIVCSITCWTSLSLLKIEHANIHIRTFNLAKHVFRWTISIVRYWVVQCITRTYLHYIMNLYTCWNIHRSRYRYRYRCRRRYRYITYMVLGTWDTWFYFFYEFNHLKHLI